MRLGSCRFATVFGRGFVLRRYWYTAWYQGHSPLLRQRFALRLRGERQGGEPHQKDQAHDDAGVAHGFGVAAEDVLGEVAQAERTRRRDETACVIAETGSRTAKPRGEQFGQVDGVSAEQRKLGEPHQRNHPEDIANMLRSEEHTSEL